MSLRQRIRKLEFIRNAKNNKAAIFWIDSLNGLSQQQLDSKSAIYLYLEV